MKTWHSWKRVLLIFVSSLPANFDFSSCPRQTGLAKPRPFLRKFTRDLYVQQSKRDHP